jgi:long-chain acyl-CoA synthetase
MAERTLFTVLEETTQLYGNKPALYQPEGGKGPATYRIFTWIEFRDAAREVACGLRTLGFTNGDVIALHAETSAAFYVVDLGVLGAGCIAAALYTSLPAQDHVRTIQIAEPKALVVEDPKALQGLRSAGVDFPGMRWIILSGQADGAMTLEELRRIGRAELAKTPKLFAETQNSVRASDPAVLYMTSGATGEPKMGLTNHGSIVANIDMGPKVVALGPDDSTLAFLPSAHIAQRVAVEFLPMRTGTPVYFSEGLSKMPSELKSVRPTFLLAPPRVWERLYASISTEVKKKPRIARNLFYTALGLGLRAARLRNSGQPVPGWMQRALRLADAVVFSKIKQRLGGRLKFPVSGAAPLGRELAQFFEAICMPLLEGYGLTEGGVVALNPIGDTKAGSIGKPLPGAEIRLAGDGELLVGGPTLFEGYYKDPAATAAVLRDGWLYTGDIAEFDDDGYIFITGRKKEVIVSSNGKKIYPARIESLFKVEPLINQVLLIGDRQPYVTALLTVNAAAIESMEGLAAAKGKSPEQLVDTPEVVQAVDDAVKRVNKQLASFEQIRRFRILKQDFTIDRGELTPTMKVRRNQVLENYRDLVSELYLGKEEMV